jgi:hypothetical protein
MSAAASKPSNSPSDSNTYNKATDSLEGTGGITKFTYLEHRIRESLICFEVLQHEVLQDRVKFSVLEKLVPYFRDDFRVRKERKERKGMSMGKTEGDVDGEKGKSQNITQTKDEFLDISMGSDNLPEYGYFCKEVEFLEKQRWERVGGDDPSVETGGRWKIVLSDEDVSGGHEVNGDLKKGPSASDIAVAETKETNAAAQGGEQERGADGSIKAGPAATQDDNSQPPSQSLRSKAFDVFDRFCFLLVAKTNIDFISHFYQEALYFLEVGNPQFAKNMKNRVKAFKREILKNVEPKWNSLKSDIIFRITSGIDLSILRADVNILKSVKKAKVFLRWLSECFEDTIDFDAAIQMALNKPEMECPPELWAI